MRNFVTTLAILVSISSTSVVSAAQQAPAAPAAAAQAAAEPDKKAAKAARPLPFQAKVFRVNKTSGLFITKTKAGKENTFHLTEKSKILKDDAPATLADIKPDEIVRGSRIKLGENKWEVVKVIIGAKPKAADKEQDEGAE